MRVTTALVGLAVLAACSPAIPDSGAGFDTTLADQQAIDAARAQPLASPLPPANIISDEPRDPLENPVPIAVAPAATAPTVSSSASSVPSAPVATDAEDIARETAAALSAAEANSGVAPLQASPSNPPPLQLNNPGISDENSFEAVSNRQSIESDAARIEANRQQYKVVAPTAVPERSGDGEINIVQYALQTNHPVGTRVYSRTGINLAARSQRNCAQYPSPDRAQIDFLERGGPTRDRLALDPDGDGYACGWNPSVFRRAVQN